MSSSQGAGEVDIGEPIELAAGEGSGGGSPGPLEESDNHNNTGMGMMNDDLEVEEVLSTSPTLRHRSPLFVRNMVRKIPEPVRSSLKPPSTSKEWLEFWLLKVPIVKWVWGYKFNYLVGDIIAGITVAIMHIPQGLAYALLANVAPIYGLYASFVPVLIYAILGTSKHISVGTFAVVELMIGNSVESVISGDPLLAANCITDNQTIADSIDRVEFILDDNVTTTTCGEVKLDIIVTLALISGFFMFVMGVCRLGFITMFLSEPLISGYTTGAAMHVFTSQLQHITGLAEKISVPNGLFRVPRTWIAMFQHFGDINWATIILSVITIVLLIIFKILNKLIKSPKVKVPVKIYRRTERKCITKKFPWPIPIPSQLIVVILGTIVSAYAMLESKYEIIPVGHIPNGLPNVTYPKAQYIPSLIQDGFVVGIVAYSITVSLAKVFAREFGYAIDSNQEFIAYGLMNMVGCFFSSFTAAGSLSRSSVQASAGGKTQLVGIISSLILLVVLLKLGSLFEQLPRAVLASIVWVALYGMFKQFVHIYKYGKLCWWDALVWIMVYLATTLLGVDIGLGFGVGVSLLVLVLRIILPTSSVLGESQEDEIFRNMDNFEAIEAIPGILVFRFQAPVCFVNSRVFRLQLEIACDLLNKTAIKRNRNTEGCLQVLCYKTGITHRGSYNVGGNNQNSAAAYHAGKNTISIKGSQGSISNVSHINHLPSIEPIHTVIIDCAPIGFMDAVGVKTMQQIVTDFDDLGIQVLFVCMTKENRDIMGRSGFFRKCSKKWLFPSMQDAVRHAQYEPVLHPLTSDEVMQQQQPARDDNSSVSSQSLNEEDGRAQGGQSSTSQQVRVEMQPLAQEQETLATDDFELKAV